MFLAVVKAYLHLHVALLAQMLLQLEAGSRADPALGAVAASHIYTSLTAHRNVTGTRTSSPLAMRSTMGRRAQPNGSDTVRKAASPTGASVLHW